ncbi:hypothetical protein F4V91_33060 [Neorhizobium galegae]|uniref:Uncharacterized protein n=1 Tax=Neorhizobium galegae TaxID=399 RepID=A0A6A1THE9_NEOGA|nr:hypothetical protein F4V91_33060 [Neorhizobium galegae]
MFSETGHSRNCASARGQRAACVDTTTDGSTQSPHPSVSDSRTLSIQRCIEQKYRKTVVFAPEVARPTLVFRGLLGHAEPIWLSERAVARAPSLDNGHQSGKLTRSGVGSVGPCIADRRFTNCELLCLRLALKLETSI